MNPYPCINGAFIEENWSYPPQVMVRNFFHQTKTIRAIITCGVVAPFLSKVFVLIMIIITI
jgi:hypothetical protein